MHDSGREPIKIGLAEEQYEPLLTFSQHDSRILERHALDLRHLTPEATAERLHCYLTEENQRSLDCINLIASESKISVGVRALLADPIGGRMGGGQIGRDNRLFPACDRIDDIEALCIESFKKLFCAQYCEYRLTTNMLAITLIYMGFLRSGDSVMSFSLPDGGDTSNTPLGPPGLMDIRTFSIPFDVEKQDIRWGEFESVARNIRPRMVAVSKTVSLFSLDIKRIKDIVKDWGGIVFVDAAHELGLVAGGVMANPLNFGADLMSGSIGKSFSGPQSGILLWNDEKYCSIISKTAFPMLVSSYQINRVAASTLSALELMEFGSEFMTSVVENAKAFAVALHKNGIPVFFEEKGFTETHQVLIDVSALGGGKYASRKLADVGVLGNQIISPSDGPEKIFDPDAMRFGFVGVSRLGMKIENMQDIANIVSDTLLEKNDVDSLNKRVKSLANKFQEIYYNFDKGLPS